MIAFTEEEFCLEVIKDIATGQSDFQEDNSGQIIIYTNMFRWEDGSIHTQPESFPVSGAV